MTSGVFTTVPTDSVWVDRDKRQRRELTGIEDLAESISKNGLINPPVIRRSGELVAGERRWTAMKQLGWTSIPVQYIEDLPEHLIKQVELEENVRRVDIPWPDQCRAVAEYHTLRSAEPGWSITATADSLGFSSRSVEQKLAVAKELNAGNSRVVEAPKFSTALNVVQRTNERKKAAAIQELTAAEPVADEPPILTADFTEWAATYDGPKFNLIHCDFPYGVNADKHDQGAGASHGGYADGLEVYLKLLGVLGNAMENVVDQSAHLIFWFSMDYYSMTIANLSDMGWKVDPFPLVWHKTDNTGILPDANRGPRRVYETAFFASRGDRKVVQAVGNATGAPVTKDFHMSEKSLVMLRHFMRMVCDEYSSVLDPTCGSANSLLAAVGLRAGRVLGLERDPEFADRARENWRKNYVA